MFYRHTPLMLSPFSQPMQTSARASNSELSGLLEQRYRALIAKTNLQFDPAQHQATQLLQTLMERLCYRLNYQRLTFSQKLRAAKPEPCSSLYLFGDVGRGKSMLMTLFYEACPIDKKRRVHFSIFMLEVHAFIHQCQQQRQVDAIPLLAEKIKQDLNLLCFDEFHITDIADAMILGRLFSQLFELGVVVVMTSNRHPKDLYQGGLLREQFLFFIKVLQGSAQIVELVANKDYRLDRQPAEQSCYYYPLSPSSEQFALTWFAKLTDNAELTPGFLTVFGRRIALTAVHNKVALTSFDVLCVDALGSADYLALTQQFDYLIVTNIPKLTADKRNEAKRLVTLIDVLYEHKIKLICTAEVSAFNLYLEGDGAFEFRRTVSRLIEMQSRDYFG